MRVNKQIRNLLLEQSETVMIDKSSCRYLGKTYSFVPVTKKEISERIEQTNRLLQEWDHKTYIKPILTILVLIVCLYLLVRLIQSADISCFNCGK
jgi:hypothetical protein